MAKWLNDELTESELSEFKKTDEYASYVRILRASDQLEAPGFDAEKALMALKNRRTLNETKVVRLHPFKKFLSVAAAVAVVMLGAYFYSNTLDENIVTGFAENKEIVLPDSSEVILNAGSQLTFNEHSWEDNRNVRLDGEAFFKVAKGERFTVATDAGTITVLGTQFNITQRQGIFQVVCFEGLVGVTYQGKETQLPAGNIFKVIDGKIIPTGAPTGSEPSWLHKESSFKSVPLKYVLAEFERQHNLEVETQNINGDQLFTGTFSNTDKELALKSICTPSQIKFKFEGTKVLFYGE